MGDPYVPHVACKSVAHAELLPGKPQLYTLDSTIMLLKEFTRDALRYEAIPKHIFNL